MRDPQLPIMNEPFAAIKAAAQVSILCRTLQDRHYDLPSFGVVYGRAGLGKTRAAIHLSTDPDLDAVLIRVWDHSTKKSLFQEICRELGIAKPGPTIGAMFDEIVQRFSLNWTRPLIIDEADKIIGRRLFESVRDLHDAARMPVILLGEPRLPKLLEREERFHSRILAMEEVKPADLADVEKLARAYCGAQLTLAPDLLSQIHQETAGNVRRIVTSLQRVIDWAQRENVRHVDRSRYDGGINAAPAAPTSLGRRAA